MSTLLTYPSSPLSPTCMAKIEANINQTANIMILVVLSLGIRYIRTHTAHAHLNKEGKFKPVFGKSWLFEC